MKLEIESLPKNWEIVAIEQIAITSSGGTPKRAEKSYFNGNIPWVKSGELRNGEITSIGESITEQGLKNSSAKIFPKGTICIAMYGATVGKVGILSCDAATNQAVCAIFLPQSIEKKYLFYSLKNLRTRLISISKGGAQPNISQSVIQKTEILLAPAKEQKRIINTIEALQAKSNKAKKALETAKPLLDKLRQSILAAAFRGDLTADWRKNNPDVEPASILLERIRKERRKRWEETELAKMRAKDKEPENDKWKAKYKEPEPIDSTGLPELPDGWCWGAIRDFGTVKGGKRLPKGSSLLHHDTNLPYIRAGNLKEGTVTGKILFLSQKDQNKISRYTISSNDTYITIVGACIGDAGVVPMSFDGANLTENAAKITELSEINNHYLGMALQSPILQLQIKEKTLSAAQGKLALSRIAQLFVPLCSLNEQKEITSKINDSLQRIEILAKKIELLSELGNTLDQSILSQAFRGELIPQDPTDEPASVLLDRIKAEREAMQPKKKAIRKRKTQAVQ